MLRSWRKSSTSGGGGSSSKKNKPAKKSKQDKIIQRRDTKDKRLRQTAAKSPSSTTRTTTTTPRKRNVPFQPLPPQQRERSPPPPELRFGTNNDDNHTIGDCSLYTTPSLATIQYRQKVYQQQKQQKQKQQQQKLQKMNHRNQYTHYDDDDDHGGIHHQYGDDHYQYDKTSGNDLDTYESNDSNYTAELQSKLGAWQDFRHEQYEKQKTSTSKDLSVAAVSPLARRQRRRQEEEEKKEEDVIEEPHEEFSLSTSLQFGNHSYANTNANIPKPLSRPVSPTPKTPSTTDFQATEAVTAKVKANQQHHYDQRQYQRKDDGGIAHGAGPSSATTTGGNSGRRLSQPVDIDLLDDQQTYRGQLWSPDGPSTTKSSSSKSRRQDNVSRMQTNKTEVHPNDGDETFSDVLSRMEQESLAGRLAVETSFSYHHDRRQHQYQTPLFNSLGQELYPAIPIRTKNQVDTTAAPTTVTPDTTVSGSREASTTVKAQTANESKLDTHSNPVVLPVDDDDDDLTTDPSNQQQQSTTGENSVSTSLVGTSISSTAQSSGAASLVVPTVTESFAGFMSTYEEQSLAERLNENNASTNTAKNTDITTNILNDPMVELNPPESFNSLIGQMIHTRDTSDIISVGTFDIGGVSVYGGSNGGGRDGTIGDVGGSSNGEPSTTKPKGVWTGPMESGTAESHPPSVITGGSTQSSTISNNDNDNNNSDMMSFAGLFSQMEAVSLGGRLNADNDDDEQPLVGLMIAGEDLSVGTFLEDGTPMAYPPRNNDVLQSATQSIRDGADVEFMEPLQVEDLQDYSEVDVVAVSDANIEKDPPVEDVLEKKMVDSGADAQLSCPSDVSLGSSIKPPSSPTTMFGLQNQGNGTPESALVNITRDSIDVPDKSTSIESRRDDVDDLTSQAECSAESKDDFEFSHLLAKFKAKDIESMTPPEPRRLARVNDNDDKFGLRSPSKELATNEPKAETGSRQSEEIPIKQKKKNKKMKKKQKKRKDQLIDQESSDANSTPKVRRKKLVTKKTSKTQKSKSPKKENAVQSTNTEVIDNADCPSLGSKVKEILQAESKVEEDEMIPKIFHLNLSSDTGSTSIDLPIDDPAPKDTFLQPKRTPRTLFDDRSGPDDDEVDEKVASGLKDKNDHIEKEEVVVVHVASDSEEYHRYFGKTLNIKRNHQVHDGPIDLDESVGSTSSSEIIPLPTVYPVFPPSHHAAPPENSNTTSPKQSKNKNTRSVTSPLGREDEEDDRALCFTDSDDEVDHLNGRRLKVRGNTGWTAEDEAVLDLSYNEMMDSISLSTGSRNLQPPLTEEALAAHVQSTQQCPERIPTSTKIQRYDSWKKKQERELIYYERLQQQTLHYTREAAVLSNHPVEHHLPREVSVRQRRTSTVVSSSRVRSTTRQSRPSPPPNSTPVRKSRNMIQTTEGRGASTTTRPSPARSTGSERSRRHWGLFGNSVPKTVTTPRKENRDSNKAKKKKRPAGRNVTVDLDTFMNISSSDDRVTPEMVNLSLAPRRRKENVQQTRVQENREVVRQRQLTGSSNKTPRNQSIFATKSKAGAHGPIVHNGTSETESTNESGRRSSSPSNPNRPMFVGSCVICHANDRTHIAQPCNHFYFCGPCSEQITDQHCPICGQGKTTFAKVYT